MTAYLITKPVIEHLFQVGIPTGNPYIFARKGRTSRHTWYDGSECLRDVVKEAGLECIVTATTLRKYTATICQVHIGHFH